MPRRTGIGTAGVCFHVLNRGARRLRLFENADDYQIFLMCLEQARQQHPLKMYAFCVMPNHFHAVVQPEEDWQLADFMKVAQGTHAKRWRSMRRNVGEGAVYQGRYRSFPIQTDGHFLRVCRYVERNALRAGLVTRAESWHWSSVAARGRNLNCPLLSTWPILQPPNWIDWLNGRESPAELTSLRYSTEYSLPFGARTWADNIGKALGLPIPSRRQGRPPKAK